MANQSRAPTTVSRSRSEIVRSIELLLVLAVFYNFVYWWSLATTPGRLLGVFACIYVVNAWITVRSSYDLYSVALFLTDVLGVFFTASFPSLLRANHDVWGYSPYFWVSMGFMELLAGVWDIMLRTVTPSEDVRKKWSVWTYCSAFAGCLCFSVFAYLSLGANIVLGHSLAAAAAMYIMVMTIKWNWDRYSRSKKESAEFL